MVKIFIEGKNKTVPESEFLSTILLHIGVDSNRYELIHTDGYKNLLDSAITSNVEIMRANTDAGGKNLVIFDADTTANGGSFTVRQNEILERKASLGLDFELFLWPDNQSDGDVEILMENIARKDLYPEFFECFSKYEHCLSQRKDERGESFYTTPNRKGKLHTYFHAIPISKTKKDGFGKGFWLWDNPSIWNMDAKPLDPIKEFLLKNIR